MLIFLFTLMCSADENFIGAVHGDVVSCTLYGYILYFNVKITYFKGMGKERSIIKIKKTI